MPLSGVGEPFTNWQYQCAQDRERIPPTGRTNASPTQRRIVGLTVAATVRQMTSLTARLRTPCSRSRHGPVRSARWLTWAIPAPTHDTTPVVALNAILSVQNRSSGSERTRKLTPHVRHLVDHGACEFHHMLSDLIKEPTVDCRVEHHLLLAFNE